MVDTGKHKKILTRLRPDPDFKYLARRVKEMPSTGAPLASKMEREPGEIPGFYAGEHKE